MAEKDGDGPSLELPSLAFGRKRGKKARGLEDDAPVAAEPTPGQAPEAETQPTVSRPGAARSTAAHVSPALPPEPSAPPLSVDEVQDHPTLSDAADEQAEPEPKRGFRLPAITPLAVSLITGTIVGVLMVGLTDAGFRFCESVQGAPSCGDPGFLLLLAIVIVIILVGKALLAAWGQPDPGSTSFLAVALICVVALLFLVDVLFNWWMIIVIPVLSMLCFALSLWVTRAFVEADE